MSQLVPYLNFGFEESQLVDSDLFYNYDSTDNAKMVSHYVDIFKLLLRHLSNVK